MVAKVVAQAAVVLLVVFLAACGGHSSPAAAPDPATLTPPTPACSREEVTRLVERFLDAFNRGDSAQLARFFGLRFEWYSVTDRGRESEDRHFLG